MLNVRLVAAALFRRAQEQARGNIFGWGLAPPLLKSWGMTQSSRLQKLRQRQARLDEELRAAKAAVDSRHKKDLHRTKLILGGALLTMPAGEREALLPMLLHHLDERQRRFVTEQFAGGESPDAQPSSVLN